MPELLYLTSSPRGDAAYSNQAATRVIDELRRYHPDLRVVERDLAADPLPHIDADFVAATRGGDGPSNARQRALLARSDALVDELLAADFVVIAAAMINFSIPSTLKAWIDFVARAGRTFRYGAGGPEGLVTGKRVFVIAASGGVYADRRPLDFQVPYLRHVLGFLGMTDVQIIDVGGTAFGEAAATQAVAAAAQQVRARCAAMVSAA